MGFEGGSDEADDEGVTDDAEGLGLGFFAMSSGMRASASAAM